MAKYRLSFFPFVSHLIKTLFYIASTIYLLALPALALQGRIVAADALIPLEAGFCVMLAIIMLGMASLSLVKAWRSAP